MMLEEFEFSLAKLILARCKVTTLHCYPKKCNGDLETPRPSPAGTTNQSQQSELISVERQITNIIRHELRRMMDLNNQIICLSLSDVCMSVCTHYPGH